MTKSLALALLLAVLIPGGAWAQTDTTQGTVKTIKVWRAQDACAKKAFKQFPDYTPESNAKREEARRLCLATGNLPPRNGAPAPGGEPEAASQR